jgi:cardiolipin synthase
VALLRGGDELFPRMQAAIRRRATRSGWPPTSSHDATSLALADALIAAGPPRRAGARGGRRLRQQWQPAHLRRCSPERRGAGGVPPWTAGGAGCSPAAAPPAPEAAWWTGGGLRRRHQPHRRPLDIHHGRTELPRLDFAVQLRGPLVPAWAERARDLVARLAGPRFDDALLDYVPLPRRLRRWWRQLWRGPERLPRQAPA